MSSRHPKAAHGGPSAPSAGSRGAGRVARGAKAPGVPRPASGRPVDPDEGRIATGGDGDGSSRPAVSTGTRGHRAAWLFSPQARARAAARERRAKPPRFKPLLLARLLGRGAMRPPDASIAPPDLSSLPAKRPAARPDGTPVPSGSAQASRLEKLDPASLATRGCRRRGAHWDGAIFHGGSSRGVPGTDSWLWIHREGGRWWALPDPAQPPFLRHGPLWWTKLGGTWFLLHDGEPWARRFLKEWESEGLVHPPSGARMIYSADLSKVALVMPGEGAALFDARTGVLLARWSEAEMPRRHPSAPAAVRFP